MDGKQNATLQRVLAAALLVQAAVVLTSADLIFAVLLALVAYRVHRDRDWLLVPIVVNGIAFGWVLLETLAEPPGDGPPVLEAFLTRGVFLAIYLIGYRLLETHRPDERPARREKRLGWRFDHWAG